MEFYNSIQGYLDESTLTWFLVGSAFVAALFGYLGAPLFLWTLLGLAVLAGTGAPIEWAIALIAVSLFFVIKPVRRILLTSIVMKVMKSILPKISQTERTALEAGVVWVEGELFSGRPNFKKILNEPYPELTAEEKAFLDGPVEKVCEMADEWAIWTNREIPKEIWDYLKKEKFFGMIIPKEYGGLGFSAMAHSEVILKLSSRSIPITITTMVPNSLGPAELLTHFGTDAQKKYYLPRLANGTDLPCFALTEPTAGSDAGAIQSNGVLFKGDDGKLYIKLNWNKRWITLAAVSTVLGIAFRLKDPQKLLGKGEDLGITCALVPANTKGVVLGERHDPLNVPFYNCPTQGHDVIVQADDAIIGGLEMAGKGWKMLMESLGAGRGISLPAQATGGLKTLVRLTGAHSTVRKQFGLSIGKFEGIEEPLARIAGYTYLLEAFRRYTLGALDQGIKPPVVTAIAKYHSAEIGRTAVNDAMDILGGTAISRGPRNFIANMYMSTPISITVEGANILTRTLMIFGQGALRAHPYAYKEVKSAESDDLKGFDDAFWGHMGHIVRNAFRAVMLSLTRGRIASTVVGGPTGRYYQKLSWASASFAILADVAMGSLGGALKTKEKITGRFADILSWLYICSAVLRRYEAEGRRTQDLPYVDYSMRLGFSEMQKAFDGIFANLPIPGLSWLFKAIFGTWSKANTFGSSISDDLSKKVAKLMREDVESRNHLTQGIFMPKNPNDPFARLEATYHIVKNAEASERKIKKAIRSKQLPKKKTFELLDEAKQKGIITDAEYKDLSNAERARWECIQVDSFTQEEYVGRTSKVSSKSAMESPYRLVVGK